MDRGAQARIPDGDEFESHRGNKISDGNCRGPVDVRQDERRGLNDITDGTQARGGTSFYVRQQQQHHQRNHLPGGLA